MSSVDKSASLSSAAFSELKADVRSVALPRLKAGAVRQFMVDNDLALNDVVDPLLREGGLLDAATIGLLFASRAVARSTAAQIAAPQAAARKLQQPLRTLPTTTPRTLPAACAPLLLTADSNLADADAASKGDGKGGGSWGLCTHLRSYGLNVDFGILSILLALRPRSSIELGSGVGLYSSWLNKMAGTSPAVGIEPKPLMRPLISLQKPPGSGLMQLMANMVNATGQAAKCDVALPTFDLVFSVNMAEHVPIQMHEGIADFLVRRTGGFLVFAAGTPGEPGIGHISNRPLHEWKAMFEKRGLVHLPRTSSKLRGTARNIDNRRNFQAFTTQDAPLGRAWDDPVEKRYNDSQARTRPGFPPPEFGWLASKECL